MALMLAAIAPRAPRLAHRLGVRLVGGVGLALMGAGVLIFTTLGTGSSYWPFGLGALVTGIGIGLATTPATTAIVSSLPAERQGIASAVNDLTRAVGGTRRTWATLLARAQQAFVNGFSTALLAAACVLFAGCDRRRAGSAARRGRALGPSPALARRSLSRG